MKESKIGKGDTLKEIEEITQKLSKEQALKLYSWTKIIVQ